MLDTSFLRSNLASVSSGIVPEARLDFMVFEIDFDDALGDFPTALVEYFLFKYSLEPGEGIENVGLYSKKNVTPPPGSNTRIQIRPASRPSDVLRPADIALRRCGNPDRPPV